MSVDDPTTTFDDPETATPEALPRSRESIENTDSPTSTHQATTAAPDTREPGPDRPTGRRRLPGPLTTVMLLAAVFFALASVGSPLLGLKVFAGTDEMTLTSPYYDDGYANVVAQNTYVDDTYTAEIPAEILWVRSIWDGHPAQWDPYTSGGDPLGGNINYALYNPLTLPYYVLPNSLAPGYEKLLEICVAILGGFLFLRRVRLGRPAALLGGLVFAGSAFMITWTNWPQTRVGAFIPWVFWGAERLLQRRRLGDVALLSLPVAFMLLGGFPAVTGYTMFTAGGYIFVRALVEYRRPLRRFAGILAGAVSAAVIAAALAAFQLLPFTTFYTHWLIEGRGQQPSDHLWIEDVATLFAPWVFGGVSGAKGTEQPFWYVGRNLVESLSYLGAASAVLVVVAVALARRGRSVLPGGAWGYLVAATGTWLVLIYVGRAPLGVLQHMPVFSSNFIGRARSILGFLLAALAGIGLDLLLRRRAEQRDRDPARSWRRPWAGVVWPRPWAGRDRRWPWAGADRRRVQRLAYGVFVWATAAVVVLVAWRTARRRAFDAQKYNHFAVAQPWSYATEQLFIGLAFAVAAILAAAFLYWSPGRTTDRWARRTRFGAATLLPALVLVQALSVTLPYYPRVDKNTFYPTTDTQSYLAGNLGHDRFAGTWNAMIMGADQPAKLRALTGHGFINKAFAALVRGVPDNPISYPTYINFTADPEVAASPVLDVLATKYFVTSPRDVVFGTGHPDSGDGGTVTLSPGQSVRVAIPQTGRLRAVGFTARTSYGGATDQADNWVGVTVRDASGATVATNRRLTAGMTAGIPFLIPVAADTVPAGTALTAEFTLHTAKAVQVAAHGGAPAVSSVSGQNDGLSLAFAGSAVVYQRLTAQPRIRWASTVISQPDQNARIALLASGQVTADQVVLNGPGTADGRPATVDIREDGDDTISTRVDAQGAGYLVVADADQIAWGATVDGKPAALVPADQGLVAVRVAAGRHTVTLHYATPRHNIGSYLSLAAIVVLIGLVYGDRRLRRRRADPTGPGTATEQRD